MYINHYLIAIEEGGDKTVWIKADENDKAGIKMFDYKSLRWEKARETVLRRDGYQCQKCKRYGRMKQAQVVHHIKHADEYPELAYTKDNLISLCNDCHNKEHPEKGKKGFLARMQ